MYSAYHLNVIASILDETSDNGSLVTANESTIKLESSSGSGGGTAAIAAYYCNSYPLSTSSPGLITAVTAADRNSSMLVSGSYSTLKPISNYQIISNKLKTTLFFIYSWSACYASIWITIVTWYKIRVMFLAIRRYRSDT